MTEEIPDKTGGGFEIPMPVIIDDHKADHRLFPFVKLTELNGNVLALACVNLLPVAKCDAEGRIHVEIQVSGHGHSIDRLIDTPDIQIRIAFPVVLIQETDRVIVSAND